MTRTGDLLDLDGARYVVTDTGPAYVYERDAKGKERQVVGGRWVHTARWPEDSSGRSTNAKGAEVVNPPLADR